MALQPTPTKNDDLALRSGDFRTLAEALDYAARGQTGYNYYDLTGALKTRLPYSELRDRAQALALKLIPRFAPGDRIAILAETKPEFHILFFACQYAGLIPTPLPLPVSLGGKDGYVFQIRQMVENAAARAVVCSSDLFDMLDEAIAPLGDVNCATYEDFTRGGEAADALRPLGPEDACYIQYSSGSTSAPKGVIGTQRSVTANIHGIIAHGLQVRSGDRAISWLPLYHDMGLVGFALAPMMCQISVDYLATSDFARRPMLWLKLFSENRGTIAFSPSFGFELCVRRTKSRNGYHEYDLSSWRVAGIGGDMVRADVLEQFAETFAENGFRRSTFLPSYGLAESTLAATFTRLEDCIETDTIDIQYAAKSNRAQPATAFTPESHRRSFAICGSALPGHEIEIRDENDRVLGEREIGRIMFRGPSVAPGYFDPSSESILPEKGLEWLDTGDMGYLLDGQLVITGRSKDLILSNGRNIWPQDIEWAVEKRDDIKQGAVAAFSVQQEDGRDEIITIVERRVSDAEERRRLENEINSTIYSVVGAQARIVFVPPRSMVMTSSGKLSRAKVKQKFLNGEFDPPASPAPEKMAVMDAG